MKNKVLRKVNIILFLLVSNLLAGQNLVPNPSFEDTLSCPSGYSKGCPIFVDELIKAPPWHNPTCASSDLFNECSLSNVGVPNNNAGYQYAKSGKGYSGLWSIPGIINPDYREYISSPLLDSLQSGVTYYTEIHVSYACLSTNCTSGTDGVGIHFSNGLPDTTGVNWDRVLQLTPQVKNPVFNVISDTLNWVKVSGTFIASGGENYITIGNFRNDLNTNGDYAYLYIDDVCISTDSLICYQSVTIKEQVITSSVAFYPNPTNGQVNISLEKGIATSVTIRNSLGQVLLSEKHPQSNKLELDISSYPCGLYFLQVEVDGKMITKKMVKE